MRSNVRARVLVTLLPLLATGLGSSVAQAAKMDAEWQNGLRFSDPAGLYRIAIGGRIHYDWARWDLGDNLPDSVRSVSGWELRRGRLYVAGDLYGIFFFSSDWELAGEKPKARNVFIGLHRVPVVGNIRVGNQRVPMLLELLTNSNYMTFLERSPASNLALDRNPGILVYNQLIRGRRATWALGLFLEERSDDPQGTATDPDAHIGALRLTGTPLYRERGRTLLHLGVSLTYRRPAEGVVNIGFVPGRELGPPSTLRTGPIPASHAGTLGFEAALVASRWSLQGEYLGYAVNGPSGQADPYFQGFYLMASFFLTGEYRPYKITGGSFFRLRPKRSLGREEKGFGAIELAVRYGRLDLDAGSEGNYGTEDQGAFGINWYLNAAIRMMGDLTFDKLNYPGATLSDGTQIPPFSATATGLTFRFQVEF